VLERSGDRLTVFGTDYDLSTARFFGAWGVLGIRQGEVDIPLLKGLDADEADSLAAHLNATLLGDVTGLATESALAAEPRLPAQA